MVPSDKTGSAVRKIMKISHELMDKIIIRFPMQEQSLQLPFDVHLEIILK